MPGRGQDTGAWSRRIADTYLQRHAGGTMYDSINTNKRWNYEQGLMLVALSKLSAATGDGKYMKFVVKNLEQYIDSTGAIATYKRSEYKLDDLGPGRALLAAYAATKQEKFKHAADTLRRQLTEQPRTSEGGFWHKKIYPGQMWLDGLFMAEPFYARYAAAFNEPGDFDDIAHQFILMAQHARDPKTGLMCHGWDERRQERWADRETGRSPSFWGRAMGWYMMGLVDVLDDMPTDHPKRKELIGIFIDLAKSVEKYQDAESHLWRQVIDRPGSTENYLESSCSAMFAYAFAKGARTGALPENFLNIAQRAFQGLVDHEATTATDGGIDLNGTCKSAGLGGSPYRDGSYEYYCSETPHANDLKGLGSFLLAALEIEQAAKATENHGR